MTRYVQKALLFHRPGVRTTNKCLFLATILFISFTFPIGKAQSVQSTLYDTLVAPCTIETYGNAWEGYLAYGLWEYSSTQIMNRINGYLIVMKTNGELVALRDKIFVEDVEYVADTLMYQGSQSGFWNLDTGEETNLTDAIYGHHDIEYNPETNTFLTLRAENRGQAAVTFDKIVEVNAKGEVLWTWDTYDYFSVDQRCPYDAPTDCTHANTVAWDKKTNIVYLNSRNLNTFCKINKTTSELIWSCGEYGDFKLKDENGKEVSNLWYHCHAVKEVEPNVFLMLDNDYHNKTNRTTRTSSIIEVTVDEENMTAWISWRWTAPREYWSAYWGDADRLPNGNRIGTFGAQTHQYTNSTGAVLAEVNQEGEVVRTYTFPYGWGIYRIEQIPSISSSHVFIPESSSFLVTVIILPILAGLVLHTKRTPPLKNERT